MNMMCASESDDFRLLENFRQFQIEMMDANEHSQANPDDDDDADAVFAKAFSFEKAVLYDQATTPKGAAAQLITGLWLELVGLRMDRENGQQQADDDLLGAMNAALALIGICKLELEPRFRTMIGL